MGQARLGWRSTGRARLGSRGAARLTLSMEGGVPRMDSGGWGAALPGAGFCLS
jgi:hypothetical protein